ncbi:MAG: hypothetical protein HYS24_13875 [Ignavibacteriales bacterium]|nr:hypothetical protein [Ignavibacteriales bacterium]
MKKLKYIQLPSDGSVVIIDDKIEQVKPFIVLLSQKSIPFTYYSGLLKELPDTPKQKIRMIFLDVQLNITSNNYSNNQSVIAVLTKLISPTNGPYVIVIWSQRDKPEITSLKSLIMTSTDLVNKPIVVLSLDKSRYFTIKNENIELRNSIQDKLNNRFEVSDQNFIIDLIFNSIQQNDEYILVDNALEKIYEELTNELIKIYSFHIFSTWEKIIHESAKNFIYGIASISEFNEFWDDNIKNIFMQLAEAELGDHIEFSDTTTIIKSTLNIITKSFSGSVLSDFENYKFSFPNDLFHSKNPWKFKTEDKEIIITKEKNKFTVNYDNKIIANRLPAKKIKSLDKPHVVTAFNKILENTYRLNSNLLIIENPKDLKITPGDIIRDQINGIDIRKRLISMFKSEKDSIKQIKLIYLKQLMFILLEITPVCDHAHTGKQITYRYIPGLLIPMKIENEFKKIVDYSKNNNRFYSVEPYIKYGLGIYKIIFDFGQFYTVPLAKKACISNRIFRFKPEIVNDIQSKLSFYFSRPGVSFISDGTN